MPLTDEAKVERAQKAAAARWSNAKERFNEWYSMPLAEAMTKYVDLRSDLNEIGRILTQRQPGPDVNNPEYECFICKRKFTHRPVFIETLNNKDTQILYNIFICSPGCHGERQKQRIGGNYKT